MKFGKVSNSKDIRFSLPPDDYLNVSPAKKTEIFIGFPRWSKKDLPGLYPKGIKDELNYYSSQLNAIELNATFYNNFPAEQISKWRDRTTEDFKFFPKVHQYISHTRRLKQTDEAVDTYMDSVVHFEHKLGISFMQMHDNFGPSQMPELIRFVEKWPEGLPLAIELRHTAWYNDLVVLGELTNLFRAHHISTVITDTAGRRDLVHMRLTTDHAFVRFVGCDNPVDFKRLDDWSDRLKLWKEKGLKSFNLFLHQNQEVEAPQLSTYFINQINQHSGIDHPLPKLINATQTSLF